MSNVTPIFEQNGLPLNRISTQWSHVSNPGHFLIRYAESIRNYLGAILKDTQEADDIAQEFFLKVVAKGFVRADPDRGRFRDYLKTSVRNAAISHLRQKRPPATLRDGNALQFLEAPVDSTDGDAWLSNWRQCLLDRAWRGIERHEHAAPGSLYHTVLRLSVAHPDDDSNKLADRVSVQAGRTLSAAAFRKQLSRARRMFAQLLVREVADTLEDATPAMVEDELCETGLMPYIQPFLPEEWRERGQLSDVE